MNVLPRGCSRHHRIRKETGWGTAGPELDAGAQEPNGWALRASGLARGPRGPAIQTGAFVSDYSTLVAFWCEVLVKRNRLEFNRHSAGLLHHVIYHGPGAS